MFIFCCILAIGTMVSLFYKNTREKKPDLKQLEKKLDEEIEDLDIELEVLLAEHRRMVEG